MCCDRDCIRSSVRLRRLRRRGLGTAPVQCYDELDLIPCPMCKGLGVRFKRIYPDMDYEDMRDFLPENYDPFAIEEEEK